MLFTPSALEKLNYEFRIETEKEILSEQNDTKKRYIGWLCEHFNETLAILKKAMPKTEIWWLLVPTFHSVSQSGKN